VGFLHSIEIKFNLMRVRILKGQLGRPNTCMTKAKAEGNFKGGGHGDVG
jgi:hypothetical protein